MNFITDTDPSQTFSIVTTINGSAQDIQRCNLDLIPLVEHLLDGFREETSLRHFVDVQDRFFVAIENSTGLAVALLVLTKETVKFLYVHKPYRRQGLATKLYKEAVEYGEKQPYFVFMYNPVVKEAGKFLTSIGALDAFLQDSAEGVSGGKVLVHTRRVYLKPGGLHQPKHKPWELHGLPVNVHLEFSSQTTTNLNVKTQLAEMIKLLKEEVGDTEATTEQNYILAVEYPSNTPIGFLTAEQSFACRRLTGVWIKPEYRRKNIATVLVATLISYGTLDDATMAAVGVNNLAAREFFGYVGFEPTNLSPNKQEQFYRMTNGDLKRQEYLCKDRQTIIDSKSYVYWDGPEEVTLDGSYNLTELKALVRFIENGGPGKGHKKHEEIF
jgi:Predicted acetyltransferase